MGMLLRRSPARAAVILLASAAAHLALFAWLGLTRPQLTVPYTEPAEIRLDIRPLYVPPRREAERPLSLRPLQPRRPRALDEAQSPVAPLRLPPAPPPAESPPKDAPALPRLSDILGGRRLDCDRIDRLDREGRERCAERLGARRADGPDYGPAAGISPRKRAAFDRAAGVSPLPPEPPGVAPEGSDNIGDPDYGGGMADVMGAPDSTSRRATRVTPRLPP
ncbi:MAG: hypothetical protein WCY15_15685 [Phenylobacterium sp.]|uniref:hypothetical protein n=1 Tax=Phenylobacterium sp. TaxID=1871053 RepID=UPI002A36E0B7|nr:hypothetical protein [Phenylobacterium sp.]MDX9996732.1 hypothetical protein [Phenylobacterium sp.]